MALGHCALFMGATVRWWLLCRFGLWMWCYCLWFWPNHSCLHYVQALFSLTLLPKVSEFWGILPIILCCSDLNRYHALHTIFFCQVVTFRIPRYNNYGEMLLAEEGKILAIMLIPLWHMWIGSLVCFKNNVTCRYVCTRGAFFHWLDLGVKAGLQVRSRRAMLFCPWQVGLVQYKGSVECLDRPWLAWYGVACVLMHCIVRNMSLMDAIIFAKWSSWCCTWHGVFCFYGMPSFIEIMFWHQRFYMVKQVGYFTQPYWLIWWLYHADP